MRNKGSMPQARPDRPSERLQWELQPMAVANWMPDITAASTGDNVISIFGEIGQNPYTGQGITDSRIAAALRSIGATKDVIVHINSPGGDFDQGVAIYNLLREHQGHVQVKIMSMAASAASIIAMAGDDVMIAKSGFMMIHNCRGVCAGDKTDMRELADWMETFDGAMAEVYSARCMKEIKAVQKMMDQSTLMGGSAAVEMGFADGFLPADEIKQEVNAKGDRIAAHLLDTVLAKAGMSRSERRALLTEFKSGTQNAAGTGTQNATEDGTQNAAVGEVMAALQSLSIQ